MMRSSFVFLDQEILVFNLENESLVKRQQIRTTRILNYTLFIDKCANISNLVTLVKRFLYTPRSSINENMENIC